MKEIKDSEIKIRITHQEKEVIKEYCDKYGWTMSDYIRFAVFAQMGKERLIRAQEEK